MRKIIAVNATLLACCACTGAKSAPLGDPTVAATWLSEGELAVAERPEPKRTVAASMRTPPGEPERAGKPSASPATSRPVVVPRVEPQPIPIPQPAGHPASPRLESPEPQPEDHEEEGALVLVPSQGRPVIVKQGDTFFFLMRLRRTLGRRIVCSLVHTQAPNIRYPLQADVQLGVVQGRYGQMILQVPQSVSPGLYDLEVKGEGPAYLSRQSVKVVDEWRTRFRIVHLSNMNIDDPAAPEFDQLLIDEINLLAPEFVLCTGDFTEWGRALSNPKDWMRALEFLGRIRAPAYVVCGDHDDESSFDRYVADNPIGTFDYGDYHGILMLDHSAHRLDAEQVRWLRTDLANHRNTRGFNFIVTHSDELDVLDLLRRQVDDLSRFVADHKLRMIVTGGHVDWDYREFATKLKDVQGPDGLVYIRTHESSTCMHDGATGISHYRIIDVNGDQLQYVYPDDTSPERAQYSVPVGRLRVFYNHPNDGTQDSVVATVQNALNQVLDDCRVWLRVAKKGEARPLVEGGEIIGTLDGGSFWVCEIRVNVPDKGGVKIIAANDSKLIPEASSVKVTLGADVAVRPATTNQAALPILAFAEQKVEGGLRYYRCDQRLSVVLTNTGTRAEDVWPVVRLNGEIIPYDSGMGDRRPLRIDGGRQLVLSLKLVLGRMSPGPHQLQVFFRSDPLKRVTTFPVSLVRVGS